MSDIINISDFKKKKKHEEEVVKGQRPLVISSATEKTCDKKTEYFGDKTDKIRASLEKINRLMAELKS
jgi:hypothetical protein